MHSQSTNLHIKCFYFYLQIWACLYLVEELPTYSHHSRQICRQVNLPTCQMSISVFRFHSTMHTKLISCCGIWVDGW